MFWILVGILFRMGRSCSGNEGAIDEQPLVAPRVTAEGSYTLGTD